MECIWIGINLANILSLNRYLDYRVKEPCVPKVVRPLQNAVSTAINRNGTSL